MNVSQPLRMCLFHHHLKIQGSTVTSGGVATLVKVIV